MQIKRKFAGKFRRNVRARKGLRKASRTLSVKTLSSMIRQRGEILHSTAAYNGDITPAIGFVNLSDFNSQALVFGAASADAVGNRIMWNSTQIDMRVSCERPNPGVPLPNEVDTITYTVFLFCLHDIANDGVSWNAGTGFLNLVNATDYYQNNGFWFLNPKKFNILRRKQFVVTNNGASLSLSSAQTQYGTDMRWTWNVPVRKVIENPNGDWKSMKSGFDPSRSYYVAIFNDDSGADGQLCGLKWNVLNTFKTLGAV